MKIVVTGGAGFIGSHIADALTEAGHEVTIFDLRESPFLRPGQRMVVGNMLDTQQANRLLAGQDVVYHLAGVAHLDIGIADPLRTVTQNITGTVTLLEAARLGGVKRFVYASSVYVYSEGGSFYRCSKQAAELYLEEYQRLHGLDYTIMRYGTVYGPRADDHNSVRRYLRQALRDRRITAKSTGEEVREYVHVRDAAQLCVRVLADEFKNQHLVLTGHNPMHFIDLLKMIREIVGQDVQIDLEGRDQTDPRQSASGHYEITPYAFRPKTAKKLVNNPYLDMGQGLIECLEEIYHENQTRKS
ncbi:MAG: NAD(P)-dependent oxidoreductase [Verrucomicrobia bacterium]|nr:NAD(P)-dependent oxidoreductase [Verrucomicrobiota bacterium]